MSETERCSDCPPVGYSTDRTRCVTCDRSAHEQLSRAFGEAEANKIIPTKNTGKQTMPEGKSEIPADILAAATVLAGEIQDDMSWRGCRDIVALALQAERERCAETAETYRQTIANYPNREAFNYYESGVLDASVGIKWLILNQKSSTEENLQHD